MEQVSQLEAPPLAGLSDWQVLLESMTDAAVIFDRDLTILALNTAHETMTGLGRAEILGRFMFDAFPPEPGEGAPSAEAAIRNSVKCVCETRRPHTLPVQQHALQSPSGEWIPHAWQITHAPIIVGANVAAILQTASNVTDIALERTLNEAQLLAARDAASVSYFSYDPDSRAFVRTASVDALFGFAPGEAGQEAGPFFERVDPQDLPGVFCELDRIGNLPLGTPARFDYRVNVPGEPEPRRVRVRGAKVIDPEDRRQKLVGVFVDLTDFELTRNKLEQAIEDKENLLVEANHRIKNSLQLASSVLRMEARRTGNGEVARVLQSANARVDAIAEVHGGLYLGGDVTHAPAGEVLRNIVEALARSVGAGETSPEIRCESADFALPTDLAIAFGLLVTELLTNALKHGDPKGARPIEVSVRKQDERVWLSVSNDVAETPGPAPETGTSIGQSLIRGFVRQLGAQMESGVQQGRFEARVNFEVPAPGAGRAQV